MRRGRALVALVVAGGGLAVALTRSRVRRAALVELYGDDGSLVTLDPGSADAERLLPLARELAAV
jgi:hypothetical protein